MLSFFKILFHDLNEFHLFQTKQLTLSYHHKQVFSFLIEFSCSLLENFLISIVWNSAIITDTNDPIKYV